MLQGLRERVGARVGGGIGVLATLAALSGLAGWALPWVRDRSGSLGADFAILMVWAVVAFAAAWFQTAFFLPRSEVPARDRERERPSFSAFQGSTILRSAVLGIALLGNLAWSNWAARDFWFSHYARIGVQATALRSDSPETRRWAIARVAETMDRSLEDLVPRLEPLMQDAEEQVRADAVAALGHLAGRMRIAINRLGREEGLAGRFEVRVLKTVARLLGDPAREVLRTRGVVRRAWIYAVGGLGDASAIPILETVIRDGEPPEVLAAVDAMGDLLNPRALSTLVEVLAARRAEPAVHAAWAAGMTLATLVLQGAAEAERSPEYRTAAARIAEVLPRLEPEPICAFLRWFPEIADASFTEALIAVARSPVFAARCERMERSRWFGAPEVIVPEGAVHEAVLRAMAVVAVGNAALKAYLEEAAGSSEMPREVRAKVERLLEAVSGR